MSTLICEQFFELKINKKNDISNYQKFIKLLPKFKRLLLITFYYPNNTIKRTIITLENPKKEIKKHQICNSNFSIFIKSSLLNKTLKKVHVEVCKQKIS